uniref:Transposable element P transposase-like GTP-binding insertion domain-containing protein n=1 Tax=Trichogramma kaykai TaxID=54128 RepID=A0ABD2XDF9_9HYME
MKVKPKMKVSLAVQVFSHSVGAALMTATLNKEIGLNTADLGIAAATSDFCTRLNRIFDCLNARSFNDPNPYRKGLSKSTRVEDELKKAVDWIKTIVDEIRSPVFPNLILTINGILLLWDRLKSKGLHDQMSTKDVLTELNKLALENVYIKKISEFAGKPRNGKTFLLQLTPDSNLRALFNTKYIAHQVIKWETLKKSEPPQCRRCQRIDHVAANCHMKYRCVKCTKDRGPGQCKVNSDNKEDLQCILCGKTGHQNRL